MKKHLEANTWSHSLGQPVRFFAELANPVAGPELLGLLEIHLVVGWVNAPPHCNWRLATDTSSQPPTPAPHPTVGQATGALFSGSSRSRLRGWVGRAPYKSLFTPGKTTGCVCLDQWFNEWFSVLKQKLCGFVGVLLAVVGWNSFHFKPPEGTLQRSSNVQPKTFRMYCTRSLGSIPSSQICWRSRPNKPNHKQNQIQNPLEEHINITYPTIILFQNN